MADQILVQKAVDAVNEFCTPEKMPAKQDAVDFLEEVVADLQSSIEALEEEIAEEEEKDC